MMAKYQPIGIIPGRLFFVESNFVEFKFKKVLTNNFRDDIFNIDSMNKSSIKINFK